MVIVVCGLMVGADTLVEIKFLAKEKQDWLQQHFLFFQGIPSHDTIGRLLNQIGPQEFAADAQRRVPVSFFSWPT